MIEEDFQIRNEVLQTLYEEFEESPWGTWNVRSVIEESRETLEVHEDAVRYVLKLIDEDRLVDFTRSKRKGGGETIELEAKGVETLQQERGGTFLESEKWTDLLEYLFQYEREYPQDSTASPEEMLEGTDIGDDELDYNVWYLDQKGWAKAHLHIGGDRDYWGVEITNFGREKYERELL